VGNSLHPDDDSRPADCQGFPTNSDGTNSVARKSIWPRRHPAGLLRSCRPDDFGAGPVPLGGV